MSPSKKKPTPQQVASRLGLQVMSLPVEQRLQALQDGLKQLDDDVRDIVEPLVFAAMNITSPADQALWRETNSILRVVLGLTAAIIVGKYLGDAVTLQGRFMGFSLRAAGGAAAFFVVFLFYPPSLVYWPRLRSGKKQKE